MSERSSLEKISWVAAIAAFILGLGWSVFTYYNPRTIEEPVDIKGSWNLEQAKMLAFTSLEKHNWDQHPELCIDEPCRPPHELIGEYNLPYRDRETYVLAMVSGDLGGSCHACAPYLSFFEFEKKEAGWKLITSDIASSPSGAWGSFDKEDFGGTKAIGDNKFGIPIAGSFMNHGRTTDSVSIYTKLGDSFHNVLDINIREDNGGADADTDWEASYDFVLKNTGLYDVVVKKNGEIQSKEFSATISYEFNGQKYILSSCESNVDEVCSELTEQTQ
ncbi:hypothetical protein HMY34_00520 [Thiothrix subterranea]|uniref:hypothetical protein n=1 Tax=Thiothrix subterranea TaxID=2735563 RepID=UPI00192BD698|nr:hypothetical protein [Thiothrix subterranea]QQZ27359.1 hypothetical protein HMY34_00520 [Thiothrix subterranea]